MRGDFSRFTFDPKKRYSGVWMQQGRVQLDSDWNEQQAINRHRIESECRDVVGKSGAPSIDPGFEITIDGDRDLYIGKGRYYVDGILCWNDDGIEDIDRIKYQDQADLPEAPDPSTLLSSADFGVVYLDVWHRDVTAIDDPEIKEKALGGADTATRTRVVWQVKVLPVKLEPGQVRIDCAAELLPKRNVALNARIKKSESSEGPCIMGPGGGFLGLENQLYRVEVHRGGPLGSATFKWARDNGSIEIKIIDDIAGGTVPIVNIGAGFLESFKDGTVVEIVDDKSDLNCSLDLGASLSQLRPLARIKGDPNSANGAILIEPPPDPASVKDLRNPRLRRWDSGEVKVEVPSANDGWISLGNEGLEIKFSTDSGQNDFFKTGDYWLIPARVGSDRPEWPYDESENPIAQLPMGIEHHCAPLAEIAMIKTEGQSPKLQLIRDCRKVFPPLTGASAMHITDISWNNDDTLMLDELFSKGLEINLDQEPDSRFISPDTMIVSVEAPPPSEASVLNLVWVVEGFIGVSKNKIKWMPTRLRISLPIGRNSLRQQLENLMVSQEKIRLRVKLKGHAIASKNGKLHLDGQAFGKLLVPKDGTIPRIDLLLPSGDGQKASDFESWCYLRSQPEDAFEYNVVKWMEKKGFKNEREMRDWCSKNYVEFWGEMAQEYIDWFEIYSKVLDGSPPYTRWFMDGKLNACYSALDRHAKGSKKNKVAFIFVPEALDQPIQKITYEQLYREVNKLANGLKMLGVKKGDRVSIYMPMIPQTAMAMLACAKIGAIHSVVFSGFSASALSVRVLDTESKVVITTDGLFRRGKPLPLKPNVDEATANAPSVRSVVVLKRTGLDVPMKAGKDIWWHDLVARQSEECDSEKMDSEDRLFILHSSGTTGKPKGIEHMHGGYTVAAAQTLHWVFDIKDTDVWWCTADIGWITGHSYSVYGPLCLGATSILYEGSPDFPDLGRWFRIIQENKVTVFYTTPPAIRIFMRGTEEWPKKYDLSSLRLLGSVGEPLAPEAWTWYRNNLGAAKLPIMDTWWQTECGSSIISPLPITELRPGSATFQLPGFNVDILNDEGKPVEPEQVGNLVLTASCPSMLKGLYRDSERYKKDYYLKYWNLKPGVFDTGDKAKRDKDGYIWLVGITPV
jgi:acetyl-CoA synthetase